MEETVPTYRAKCPHCLGDIEKRYRAWGDWYFVCMDCNCIVPSASFQHVPIEEHFAREENNHLKEATLNKIEAKDKKEEEE